jgi:hypothetical protein
MNTVQFVNITGVDIIIWDNINNRIAYYFCTDQNIQTPIMLKKIALELPVARVMPEEVDDFKDGKITPTNFLSIMYTKIDENTLPPLVNGVVYIVSEHVAMNCPRPDFVYPHSIQYDESGSPLGFKYLALSTRATEEWDRRMSKNLDSKTDENVNKVVNNLLKQKPNLN